MLIIKDLVRGITQRVIDSNYIKHMERKLYKMDATGQTVGRLASDIAIILRGKNKPEFEAHIDGGDIVEVENIKKIKDLLENNPGEILERAVREMLPPVKFRKAMLKRLTIK